jgi:hypothetical protein
MRRLLAQVFALVCLSGSAFAQGFNIPKPDEVARAIPVKPALGGLLAPAVTGPSTMTIIVGVGAALLAAVLFFFLKGGLFNHLIDRRVPPSNARSASWAFYTFLVVTAWTAITGFVVGIWSSIPFLAGGATLAVTTLVFFLVSYSGALKRAK